MAVIGFHASHEQIAPSALLRDVQHAEEVGFEAAMCSDHLAPWSRRQGHSGYAWSWLGAALATTSLRFGVVTAPGQRYHPVIAAQRVATLGEMFPGRFWAALGSGEAMNEHVTGEGWPSKPERERRLVETVDLMRRLLAGEEVTHDGLVSAHRARVWSRPAEPPPLLAAAVTAESAARHAAWADGLITVAAEPGAVRDIVAAYRDAGGRGPVCGQLHLSWAPTEDEALAIARDQWQSNLVPAPEAWDVEQPEDFERRTAGATEDELRRAVWISSDPGAHAERIRSLVDAGLDELYLHHVGQEQAAYLDAFGEHVLPEVAA
ncbi:TIGR03885 family FMN-dependent LLM class oxidoreductase [Agrococcus carbonis]|uniref:Probable non-F420 flavinoid oxidoreductase n=1 Tax=Agrococcus carbonis TaxID=684552 RepID=A0A1H1PLB1_9MICO|nr:TIGR03885 family FMN-dependent LLM class oxidoreductase [Agrococcus carbonis]SDS11877.1 probable non-F420 flavinoid oxidoreductase [Agrococcus carbonis]